MKFIRLIHILLLLSPAMVYSQEVFFPHPQVLDERSQTGTTEQIIPIDKVWAGHPVGFALLTHGNRQYISYYNAERHIMVGQRNLSDKIFELFEIPPYPRKSRKGTSTVLGWDSHNSITMEVDQAGHIHWSGNMHVNGLTYFRTTRVGDISSLKPLHRMVGREEDRCTYPRFIKTVDGVLIFRYRDGGSGNGNDIYNIYSTSTRKWTRLYDTPLTDGLGEMNAYASQPLLMKDNWYHMYWVWRNTPDCSTNHDLSYIKSPDMKRWYNVRGELVQLPVTFENKSVIVDPIPVKGGIINLAARLCLDHNNHPIFAYHKYDQEGNLQLYTARFTGKTWDTHQITDWDYRWEFSGNGSINTEVSLGEFSRREDGNYELSYRHVKYGRGTLLLDRELHKIGRVMKPLPFTTGLDIEGEFPGLQIQTATDLGTSGEKGVSYYLKWETLNRNRDRPRPEPWPEPSQLYLYKQQKPIHTTFSEKLSWQSMESVEEIVSFFPERMSKLLDAIDMNKPELEGVKTAREKGNLTQACQKLLGYYEAKNPSDFFIQPLPNPSEARSPGSDIILKDIFTVQKQSGQSPRDESGHLDWHYQGPLDDQEWAWGVNRHYFIRTLLQDWYRTGNDIYASAIDQYIKDWIISSLPYPGVKSSTAMWRGLEVSFREKVWAQVFYGLMENDQLSPATRLLILSSIPEHAHYARHFHAKGNWLTMEMSGLATSAAAWPEFREASDWINYAKDAMVESMKEQVYPDGVQTELTSHYHYVALANFDLFYRICDAVNEPLPDFYTQTLESMWNYLAYSMRSDGYGILNNDSDRDYNRDRISNVSKIYGREDWQFIASRGISGQKPEKLSVFYPWAGQVIMREGFEEKDQWAFFDIGPWGSGHQHNDKLHLSVMANGLDFLVDAGRFAYRGAVADKFRGYARGSQGHNLVMINGKGQGDGPKFAKEPLKINHFTSTLEYDYAWGECSHFLNLSEKNFHQRQVFYARGEFWVVVDRITVDQPREVQTLWHWHPDCQINENAMSGHSGERDKYYLHVLPLDKSEREIELIKGQEEPEIQGWYSEEYNSAEPSSTSIFSTKTDGTETFVWVIYPSKSSEIDLKTTVKVRSSGEVYLRVNHPGRKWQITIPANTSESLTLL